MTRKLSEERFVAFFCLFFILLTGCDSPPPVAPVVAPPVPGVGMPGMPGMPNIPAPTNGASVLAGTVTLTQGCLGTTVQIILLTATNTPIYQNVVQANGNFQLYTQPGTYSIVAQGGSGCGVQRTVTTAPNQVLQVPLALIPNGLAGVSLPSGYFYCSLSALGCNGSLYPGSGSIGMGKPNLYLSGPAGTQFKVKLNFGAESNLLIATPIYGDSWEGRIVSDGSSAGGSSAGNSGNNLEIGGAKYGYLFYDIRTEPDRLQNQKTFCVSKDDLIPSMANYLEQARFRENEIRDFKEAWSQRFPPSDRYCVYPQEGNSIDSTVGLEITPVPKSITRVWFIVVPAKAGTTGVVASLGLKANSMKFVQPARNTDQTLLAKIQKVSQRAIASVPAEPAPVKDLEVHEWGVGFLFQTPDKAPDNR